MTNSKTAKRLNKLQVFASLRTLVGMKSCIAKFSSVFILLFFSIPTLGQKGFNFSLSSGYRIGVSNSTPQNQDLESISPLVDYGKGFYASLAVGYCTNKRIEFGSIFTYHQYKTEIIYDLPSTYNTLTLKANTLSVTPYIRLRKSVRGPFIPYIHLGIPLTFAEVLNTRNASANPDNVSFSQSYYPRKLAVGFNGGLGFYTVMSNHWQFFFETNFIGLTLNPDKLFYYGYSTNNPVRQGMSELNTKEEKEVNGNTVKLPFSNIGFGFGFRYSLSKMIEVK